MSKFLQRIFVCAALMAMPFAVFANDFQFTDPGFEDWGGEQFDGNAQPKYWNFSNVSQMGVNKNFAHKTTGRSGSALKIQDQFVGALGIGATSPGYVALGHPWAYVSGLTSIEDATAGTYGGISWKTRPDTMVVWIKRYYDSSVEKAAGDHSEDENFNLIFYSWSGTSYAPAFKAKNLSCTDISASHANDYCKDEESDIRQALNGNECGTQTYAKQIAEGWYYEKKAYANWTQIKVPIYYFNDDVPEKCNVILSAGNYPNFRANSGQNAGMSLDVDDISLIYSSKIQKLYVNDREWKGFNPNTTEEQTYTLGLGATEMPTIKAYRGVGSLTNNRGGKANFPGRRLSDSECNIQLGTVDGEPTIITVKAEDGSSTTTYRIKFVSTASSNARLAEITVNGKAISGFNAYLQSYDVALPYGTTDAPIVDAAPQDGTATVAITQATSPTGKATILVTAGDGTQLTYSVQFSVAALNDATLKNIFVDGTPIPDFSPSKSNYSISLPLGTTTAPAITWESAYPAGVQKVELLSNTLEQGAQIKVSIPGGTATKTYKLSYKIEASTYSYLAGIQLDGEPLEGFTPAQLAYTINLPMGATALPAITWTKGDNYQTVTLFEGGVNGVTRIEVKAASGATSTYRLTFRTAKSGNTALAGIAVGGTPLEDFQADKLNYNITLPTGTTMLPEVTYTKGDEYQTVNLSVNQTAMTVRLVVTAGDGSTRLYIISFDVQKSANASLNMIYLDGEQLTGFEAQKLNYSIVWTKTTSPKVTVDANPGQSITIAKPALYGVIRIIVTPEEGAPQTYTVQLNSPDDVQMPAFPTDSFPAWTEARLAGLYIDGEAYAAFDKDIYSYTYPLALGTHQVPAVMPVAATLNQTITVEHGAVNHPTIIRVQAADKTTTKVYTILFTVPSSSNTALSSVDIDGAINFNFDPAQQTYNDVLLPYGTTTSPTLTVERGESTQSLVITEAPIGQPSTIVVTAEDGSQTTYTFTYKVAFPDKSNTLLAIVVDGIGALDMNQGPNFDINLPYGATDFNIVSMTKNYPEQEIYVLKGGVLQPTTITVKSLNPAEADMIYTITPHVPEYDPAILTDIKIDGVSLSNFRPDVFNYVVSVDVTPTVTYTEQEGADVTVDSNVKWVKLTVVAGESDEYNHTYQVTFYYPGDITFDMGFNSWQNAHNDNTNSDGQVPTGWHAPIDAITSGDAGTYNPESATQPISGDKTEGANSAELATEYLLTSAESMPGFLSLSQPTVSVGKWLLWFYEIHSSLAFGDPISFRNTPDNVQLDYKLKDYNRVEGWRFIYNANGMRQVNFSEKFSSITANQWRMVSEDITYDADYIPMTLDILISAANSDNLEDYFVSSDGAQTKKRFTSHMNVDNLRFNYRSDLAGLSVNGTAATISGTDITATIDADFYGTPSLVFSHAVQDQMPVINWSAETNGIRTATIKNYAEDLSFTEYTLTVTRPKSSNTTITYQLDGKDLTVVKGSPYQTITVTKGETEYTIVVKAEDGTTKSYTATWTAATPQTPQVTTVPAGSTITGTSTAQLLNLVWDPVVNYSREYALDSVVMVTTDTCYYIYVYGTNANETYIFNRNASNNALLASMALNGKGVPDFYSQDFDYDITLTSMDDFQAVAQEAGAELRYTAIELDAENVAVFVQVTAPDGVTQTQYSVHVRLHTPGTCADLTSILVDDDPMANFQTTKYTYDLDLPTGSTIPQLSAVACDGAIVEVTNDVQTDKTVVTFTVTSEDGNNVRTYTVNIRVLPSDVCTLNMIYINATELPGFLSSQTSYTYELPYGTQGLPEIDYDLTDPKSTAELTTAGMTAIITVKAEDGSHTTVYTITFTIAKSNNADLQAIYLDGTELASFEPDEYNYTVELPYGSTIPTVTATAADPSATVVVNESTITVTAEDGVTTHTYTVTFTIAKSTNALLLAINLDGVLQEGFESLNFEYENIIDYGAPMPEITWVTGDEQQQVDTVWTGNTLLTITVTAGDGVTTNDYVITFTHLLSPNWHLQDLQVRGTTIDGFDRDQLEYAIIYPVGTDPSALADVADIVAVPEETGATVSITRQGNDIQIFVTAPNGTEIGVYTITQEILLSNEARLKMIWTDGTEVRDFDKDSLTYTIILRQGEIVPEITAEPLDALATWDLGVEQEMPYGKLVEVYSVAEDGTVLTYKLRFEYAKWNALSDAKSSDYLFYYYGDNMYKAVSISIGAKIAIYDLNGHCIMVQEIPTAHPADVDVFIHPDNSDEKRLLYANPSADGVYFKAIPGELYFYVYFNSKTKRVEPGRKFGLR